MTYSSGLLHIDMQGQDDHLIQSFVLRNLFIFRSILRVVQISSKIIILTFPICVLLGLINLHVGLMLKSLLCSLKVIKQFFILNFSVQSSIFNLLAYNSVFLFRLVSKLGSAFFL